MDAGLGGGIGIGSMVVWWELWLLGRSMVPSTVAATCGGGGDDVSFSIVAARSVVAVVSVGIRSSSMVGAVV